MKNVIPRNFNKIVAEMLIDTSCDKRATLCTSSRMGAVT